MAGFLLAHEELLHEHAHGAAFSLALRSVVAQRCGPSLDVAVATATLAQPSGVPCHTQPPLPASFSQLRSHRAVLAALPELRLLLSGRPRQR